MLNSSARTSFSCFVPNFRPWDESLNMTPRMAARSLSRMRRQMPRSHSLSQTTCPRPCLLLPVHTGPYQQTRAATKIPPPTGRAPVRKAPSAPEFLDPETAVPHDLGLWQAALSRIRQRDDVPLTAEQCYEAAIRYCQILRETAGRTGWEMELLQGTLIDSSKTLHMRATSLTESNQTLS